MPKERHTITPAAYITLIKDDNVLLLRRFNTGYEDGNYSMIAGHVDPGETFTQCVIREAAEEAGITLHAEDLQVTHIMHRDSHCAEYNERLDVFFTTKKWTGEIINREPHKCDELAWYPLDNIPDNTIPYIKQALYHIQNSIPFSEVGWN